MNEPRAAERASMRATRRDAMRALGATALGAGLGSLPARLLAASTSEQVIGHHPQWLPAPEQLAEWLERLHGFGPIRATGTPQCRAFEEFLARELAALGCAVERDQHRLTSWECDVARDCSIVVREPGGTARTLDVLGYYPFCASTRHRAAATGRVQCAPRGLAADRAAEALIAEADPARLAESIVVVEVPIGWESQDRIAIYPETFGDSPIDRVGGPPPLSAAGNGLVGLLQGRCKGLVLCYTDVSDETARYNYRPFSEPHGGIPALWVGAGSGRYLRSLTDGATLELRCDAVLVPDARADSIVATLRGESDEVIFLTTHTDGPNEVNDNGALGLLALATYASRIPAGQRRRTLVFSLPTGHYAIGAIADPVTGSGKRAGTRGLLERRPELLQRMVAQLALEQMGAMEWADLDGRFAPTGRPAPQFWVPTPALADAARAAFAAAVRGEDPRNLRAALAREGVQGEGSVLRQHGVFGLGLMGRPHYFFRADPAGVLDKLSAAVMHSQVSIASKLLAIMDRSSVAQLRGEQPIADAELFTGAHPDRVSAGPRRGARTLSST
jgi:hypothetical protein